MSQPFEPAAPRPKGERGMFGTFLGALRETFVPTFPEPWSTMPSAEAPPAEGIPEADG